MRTLKLKFTVLFSITLIVVVSAFAAVVYTADILVSRKPISSQEIARLIRKNQNDKLVERLQKDLQSSQTAAITNEKRTERFAQTLKYVLPPTFILSALVAYAVSSYLVAPIEMLVVGLQAVGNDTLTKRLTVKRSSREIEDLASAFNKLLDQVDGLMKVQEQFMQDASHELKTPIAAMKTSIQVFREKNSPTIEEYRALIDTVERLNDKLARMSINITAINGHAGVGEVEVFDVLEVVDECIEGLLPLAVEKHVSIHVEGNERVCVKGSRNRFLLMFKNVLENAVKYTSTGKNIAVTVRNGVTITVSDEGIGIPESDLEHVFDRFYRGKNAHEASTGEGLGLSVVKQVVQEMNGMVAIESVVGKGTTVALRIPKSV